MGAKRVWLKEPLAIYTGGEEDARGGVVIEGAKVAELIPLGGSPKAAVDETILVRDQVLIPGLINTHHHFYQTLTRAFPPALNKRLFPWLQTLYPVWGGLKPEQHALATRLALIELLLSGCTTAADHHYLFPEALTDAIDIQAEQAEALGIRVMLTRGSMSLGQEQGGLPPQHVVQTEQAILDDSERLINRWHQRQEGAMVQVALAPCSPFSVTAELMQATARLARREGVRLHTHLAETEDENRFCIEFAGLRPLDYMESLGWLGPDVWYAHGIHFNDDEVRRLGLAGAGVAHCPSSNMILASGIARGRELEQAGVSVGIAVDGSASNDGSNMIQELRQALLIQRLRYQADEVSHLDILRWATQGSAACLGRADVGTLEPGAQADIALFKLDELRFSGAGDPLAALLLCGAHRAEGVLVAGEWKVKGGQPLGIDLEQLQAQHQEAAQALVSSWM